MPSSLAIAVPNGTTITFASWTFDNSAYVRSIRLEGCSRVMHDVTALSQTGAAQYIASAVTQPGKMIVDMFYDEDLVLTATTGLASAMDGSSASRTTQAIEVVAPDGAKITTSGIVESYDISIEHDTPRSLTLTIQLTALCTFVVGA